MEITTSSETTEEIATKDIGDYCENWYGIGDGFCDDISNNYECRFDGGDCCLNPVINKYSCNECICHAENKTYPVTNKIKKFTIGPTFPYCQYIHQHKIDDGYCNDEVNMMAECDYDGGDCCLAEIDDLKCDECICHQDGSRHPTRLCWFASIFVNDTYCDDFLNTPQCLYDGGDCCLQPQKDHFCTICSCIIDILNQ